MSQSESNSRRVLRSILWIVLLLFSGGAVAVGLYAVRKAPPKREMAVLPPLVETMEAKAQVVVEHFVGYGSARAIHRAEIAAELSATVIERVDDIREGSVVAEGQVLFRLDSRQYEHAAARVEALAAAERASLEELAVEEEGVARLIATAERETRVAREERNRVAGLFEKDQATKKEFDFANLAYQQAQRVSLEYELQGSRIGPRRTRLLATIQGFEEEAALGRLNIERCEIRAPFAAHIDSLHVDAGDHVVAGIVLATLIDPSRVEVPVQLPGSIHDRLHRGAVCKLRSESSTESSWSGTIARISPAADAQTRTFAAYVVVDNAAHDRPLVPGVFVTAEIEGPSHPDSILVPRRAVRNGRVYVVVDDRSRARVVHVDRYIEDQAMVSGELQSGDRVILTRLDRLADGSPVRTRETKSTVVQTEVSTAATEESLSE